MLAALARRPSVRADLQVVVRQGEPQLDRELPRPRARRRAARPRRRARRDRAAGAHRRARAGAVRAGGRGVRGAPDPGAPLPADRPPGRRRPHRARGGDQEGAVHGARRHAARGGEGALDRQRARGGDRARHHLRLSQPGGRHAVVRLDAEGRHPGLLRRHALDAASRRTASARAAARREFAEPLARAAVAAGADGVFLEVHPEPERALSDRAVQLAPARAEALLRSLVALRRALRGEAVTA